MWDYTNNGAQDPEVLAAVFPPGFDYMDGVSTYTVAFVLRVSRALAADSVLFGQRAWPQFDAYGWLVYLDSSQRIRVWHADGPSSISAASPALALNTLSTFMIVWNTSGTDLTIYRNGSSWHTDAAFSRAIVTPKGLPFHIGAESVPWPNLAAVSGQVGSIAIWPDTVLSGAEAAMWHAGIVPVPNRLTFFHRCTSIPGRDECSMMVPDCYQMNLSGPSSPQNASRYRFDSNIWLYSGDYDGKFQQVGTPNERRRNRTMVALAGQELKRRHIAGREFEVDVLLPFLSKDLGDDLRLKHRAGLEPTGEGFGYGAAPQRLARIVGMDLGPDDRAVRLALKDMKRQAVSYYSSLVSPVRLSGDHYGVFEVVPNCAAPSYDEDSAAYHEDASGVIRDMGPKQLRLTHKGFLGESRRSNQVTDPAFQNQFTSWVVVDPAGGSCTAVDPGEARAFDYGLTQYGADMYLGATAGVDYVELYQAAIPGVAGKYMTFSFYHNDVTGHPIRFRIQRASDGLLLQNAVTGGWGPTGNLHYADLSPYKTCRYVMPHRISVGGGGDTYTITFLNYNLVPYQRNWILHVQFEEGQVATSPIVPGATNRECQRLVIRNPEGLILPTSGATIMFEFEPLWADDESEDSKYILRLLYPISTDRLSFYWQHSTTRWICDWFFNTSSQASVIDNVTWSAGDTMKIAIRWLSDGDLGKPDAQGQLFMKIGDGSWTEGSVYEFNQSWPTDVESLLYVGFHDGTPSAYNAADGYVRHLTLYPEALPFEEIQAITEAWR